MTHRGPRSRPWVRWLPTSLAVVAGALALAAGACAPRSAPGTGTIESAVPSGGVAEASTARRSPGCTALGAAPLPERLVVDGREREVLVTAPVAASAPHDLVIAFHGRTNDADQARGYFGLDEAMPGALIVYPRALPAAPGSFAWRDPGDPVGAQRDVALVDAIVAAMGAAHCIDLDRVFVVGHSLGAFFANDLACQHAGRVRAVASVAGGVTGDGCVGATAALLLHHPDDRLVPISEGAHARDTFLAANTLPLRAARTEPASLGGLRCDRYGDGDAAHPVLWCLHGTAAAATAGDPHGWPEATAAAIAAFFDALP